MVLKMKKRKVLVLILVAIICIVLVGCDKEKNQLAELKLYLTLKQVAQHTPSPTP